MLMVNKTGKRLTAKTALFFLVAASTWAFLPGPGALSTNAATPVPAPSSSTTVCADELDACKADSTCVACAILATNDSAAVEDCIADSVTSGSSLDTCLAVGAEVCCSDVWNDSECRSNDEFTAVVVCGMEDEYGCSAGDLLCYDESTGAVLASSSVALFKHGPLLTAKIAVAGALGLVVTIATLIL